MYSSDLLGTGWHVVQILAANAHSVYGPAIVVAIFAPPVSVLVAAAC